MHAEDYPIVLVADLSHAAQISADVYHVARCTRVVSNFNQKLQMLSRQSAFTEDAPTSTSDASDGGPHESGGPTLINDKGNCSKWPVYGNCA